MYLISLHPFPSDDTRPNVFYPVSAVLASLDPNDDAVEDGGVAEEVGLELGGGDRAAVGRSMER